MYLRWLGLPLPPSLLTGCRFGGGRHGLRLSHLGLQCHGDGLLTSVEKRCKKIGRKTIEKP